jgi:hypothetical protein
VRERLREREIYIVGASLTQTIVVVAQMLFAQVGKGGQAVSTADGHANPMRGVLRTEGDETVRSTGTLVSFT